MILLFHLCVNLHAINPMKAQINQIHNQYSSGSQLFFAHQTLTQMCLYFDGFLLSEASNSPAQTMFILFANNLSFL